MSDLERPYVERRASGAPSSCPVCGAATRYLGDTGIITCRSPAGPDHFEWRPTAQRVASERVDGDVAVEWRDPEPRTLAGKADADNRRYDNSLTTPQPQVEVDPPPPLEGELLGVDYLTATAARLGGDAGRLAAIHSPQFDSPPRCSGCGSDGPISRLNRRANWPCATAKLALEMMGLLPSDIAITKKE